MLTTTTPLIATAVAALAAGALGVSGLTVPAAGSETGARPARPRPPT